MKEETGSLVVDDTTLERHRWRFHLSIFDAKLAILGNALRLYRAHPRFLLQSTA